MLPLIPFLVFTALTIVARCRRLASANGTLGATSQERIDRQLESIVRQLSD